jgi:hypothetical protein
MVNKMVRHTRAKTKRREQEEKFPVPDISDDDLEKELFGKDFDPFADEEENKDD